MVNKPIRSSPPHQSKVHANGIPPFVLNTDSCPTVLCSINSKFSIENESKTFKNLIINLGSQIKDIRIKPWLNFI